MATQFQHRLVGTLALISIGVIFLPDVFDGEKKHYQEKFQAIPLQPPIPVEVETVAVLPPEQVKIEEAATEQAKEVMDVAQFDQLVEQVQSMPLTETVNQSNPSNRVISASQTLPAGENANAKSEKMLEQSENEEIALFNEAAWVIRLGTFRNTQNAENLVSKLRDQGFPAQMSPRSPRDGQFVRVEVGPDLSKQKLADMVKKLEDITGLKGQLIRFEPLKS